MRLSATASLIVLTVFLACVPPPPDGAEGEGEGEGEGEPVDFGFVFIDSDPTLGFSQAGAVFRRGLRFAFDCSARDVAGCTVLQCGPDALPFDAVSAGAVQIAGALAPLSLPFTAGAGYEGVTLPGDPLFAGGETLVATAVGDADGVPPFSLAVTAPSAALIDSPAWPSPADALVVVRAEGLALSWTGASAGELATVFNSADLSVEVTCTFPAAAGAAAVPAAALAELPAGDAFLDVELRDIKVVVEDGWQLELSASTHAFGGTADVPAVANVTLQ